jgi:hypothetical protein
MTGKRRTSPMSKPEPQRALIPDRIVAEQRYFKSTRTLRRWEDDPELGFPPAIYIRGRRYRDAAALDAWDAKQRAAAGIGPETA